MIIPDLPHKWCGCYLAAALVARSAVFFAASGTFFPASVATSRSLTKKSFSVAHSFSANP